MSRERKSQRECFDGARFGLLSNKVAWLGLRVTENTSIAMVEVFDVMNCWVPRCFRWNGRVGSG